MQYALLIYEDQTVYGNGFNEAMQAIIPRHIAFGQANHAAILTGRGLQGPGNATTVRTSSGEQSLHDGPYAETREQLGGFYVVEAADLDAAIAIARQIPISKDGAVEVRPVIPTPEGAAG